MFTPALAGVHGRPLFQPRGTQNKMEDASRRVEALAALLCDYKCLSMAMVKDFFTHDHWNIVLPVEWLPHLDDLSIAELAMLLESAAPPSMATKMSAWPSSLQAFMAAAHDLRLPGQLKPRGGAEGSGEVQTLGKAKRKGGSVTARGRCSEESQIATTALRVAIKTEEDARDRPPLVACGRGRPACGLRARGRRGQWTWLPLPHAGL